MSEKIFVAVSLAGALLAGSAPAAEADRYQWLEAPTDAKALGWAQEQSAIAHDKIAAMPGHARIEAELMGLLAAGDPPPEFVPLGKAMLRVQKSVANPHGVLSIADRDADGKPGAWRQLLSVDELRKTSGKPYELHFGSDASSTCLPETGHCILSLSPAGSDEVELREFDLNTGRFVEDGFKVPTSRAMSAWLDKDHLLIQHTVGDVPKLPTGWAGAVYVWTRGTPLTAAREIFRADPRDAITSVRVAVSGGERVGVIMRAIDYSTFEYRLVRPNGSVELIPLPTKTKQLFTTDASPRVLLQLSRDAEVGGRHYPTDTILTYETSSAIPVDHRLSVLYTPRPDDFLAGNFGGISASQSKVRLVMARHGVYRISTYERAGDGWREAAGSSEPVGVSVSFGAADPLGDDVIVERTGYLTPSRIELLGAGDRATSLFAAKPSFDASRFRVEVKSTRSKDGTDIDYFLLRPASPAKPGAVPTLMTGYGAFGISFAPGYLDAIVGGKSLVPWLDRGGALVLPLVRGGGDRGEAWHISAMREKRQNSYDDFAAVTEALIRDRFTTADRIGVFGQSNGGLLAAVMGTQRPDLYGAVVSDVPLTDLVRMPFMGMGAAWTDEYGDANDPAMRAVIERYSPFQQVRKGQEYPPFLITVATSDNRVGPGHARKLAARLEDAGATVYYLEDQEGGHGVSDPLARPELMADRMTFLIDTLMH
jgi:prolyl oligopeptidase